MIEEESGPQWVNVSHVQQLQDMGFQEKAARTALAAAGDRVEPALEKLQVCRRWTVLAGCQSVCIMQGKNHL